MLIEQFLTFIFRNLNYIVFFKIRIEENKVKRMWIQSFEIVTYRNLMAENKDGDKALQCKIETLENSLIEVRAENIRLSSK